MTDPREIIARALPGALAGDDGDVYLGDGDPMDDWGITVDGYVSMPKAADAILSALDEAGYGVYRVTKFTTPLGGTINYPHIEQMEAASPGYTERRNAMKKENRG